MTNNLKSNYSWRRIICRKSKLIDLFVISVLLVTKRICKKFVILPKWKWILHTWEVVIILPLPPYMCSNTQWSKIAFKFSYKSLSLYLDLVCILVASAGRLYLKNIITSILFLILKNKVLCIFIMMNKLTLGSTSHKA